MKTTLPLSQKFIEAHEGKLAPLYHRYQREKSLHPTLLFSGLEGVGKKSTVLAFIQYLFCDRSIFATAGYKEEETASLFGSEAPSSEPVMETPTHYTPCGECRSCKRAIQNQWLDLYWLEPETNAEETRIGTHKIDAFREIKTKLGMGPVEEPYKVVVITEADRMTPQASNAILKTLEEPPPNWIFILTAADSSRLLPTILSRCIEIRLSPLTPQQIFSILQDSKGPEFNSDRTQIAARAAQGSLSRALFFLEEETWKTREMILGCLSNPAREWMKLVDHLASGQKELILALDQLESIFNDLLQFKVKGSDYEWVHSDQKVFLQQWMESKHVTEIKIIHVLTEIAEKRRLATLTLNAKLLAQEALIPLLESILQ